MHSFSHISSFFGLTLIRSIFFISFFHVLVQIILFISFCSVFESYSLSFVCYILLITSCLSGFFPIVIGGYDRSILFELVLTLTSCFLLCPEFILLSPLISFNSAINTKGSFPLIPQLLFYLCCSVVPYCSSDFHFLCNIINFNIFL